MVNHLRSAGELMAGRGYYCGGSVPSSLAWHLRNAYELMHPQENKGSEETSGIKVSQFRVVFMFDCFVCMYWRERSKGAEPFTAV